jgi:hypothetical protein
MVMERNNVGPPYGEHEQWVDGYLTEVSIVVPRCHVHCMMR